MLLGPAQRIQLWATQQAEMMLDALSPPAVGAGIYLNSTRSPAVRMKLLANNSTSIVSSARSGQ